MDGLDALAGAATTWYRDPGNRVPSQGTAVRITPALDAEAEAFTSQRRRVHLR